MRSGLQAIAVFSLSSFLLLLLFLVCIGEIIFDAASKGSVHNIRKISPLLVDGLISTGQQQNVCIM